MTSTKPDCAPFGRNDGRHFANSDLRNESRPKSRIVVTRGRIFLDWAKIGGGFEGAMRRVWHEMPTAIISFGYPYLLYDAPRVPTYMNAYATMVTMQRAVVDALLGRIPWNRRHPVDPFCGLEDAHY
jgi:beta-N-acetylhexosaminidase